MVPVQVTMTGGDEFAAQVVGVDADKDVAVLRLSLPDTVDREARPPVMQDSYAQETNAIWLSRAATDSAHQI